MKHFLKPLGHCLTTAVMTSAMLRVYALPPVKAATLDVEPQPSSDTATAAGAAALVDPNLNGSTPVAPPEVIYPVESVPAPEVAPPAIPSPVTSPAAVPLANDVVDDAVNDVANPSTVAEPDLTPLEPIEPTVKPDAAPTVSETETDLKADPLPSTQKAEASPSRTIAGMRQIVEKRLETIVEQDKQSREAKWQQNLIQVTLEYAWQGKFDAAREVAANPALPLDLQISLLSKIAAIETQFLASQVGQSPNAASKQAQAGQAADQQGRKLPSGDSSDYSTVSGLSSLPSYAGVDHQCPAIASQASQSISPPQTSARPTVAKGKPTGVPAFIPALGENLASRLAHLSQTSIAASAQPMVKKSAPLIAPQLFVGVAASSVQVQPQSQLATQPQPVPSQIVQLKAKQSKPNQSKTLQTQTAQPSLPKPLLTESAPITAAGKAIQATTTANLKPRASLPLGDPLKDSFQPFGFAFSDFLDDPLDWAWNWWHVPTPQAQAEFSVDSPALPMVAETGLTDRVLLQTIEQDLTAALEPPRDARKLSLPNLPLSNAVLKAPIKTPVYNPTALLAVSCVKAQLAQSDATSPMVDPTTAKQFGWVNLMFPLPIPAVITSAFGWRTHPISGDLRFHTGLDLGAPMGTPVLAAGQGRVVAADMMGGYGLAVVVEDETTHQRNLYAHLSGIAVQPGALVKQGAILGWVGSTGNSTGPHLHFEAQVKTETGWTVIDPLAHAAVSVAQGQQE